MSKNFKKVKDFYDVNLWDFYMVWNAVERWITAEDFLDITGNKYKKE